MIKNASLGWFDRVLNKCEPNNYSSLIKSKSRTRITQVEQPTVVVLLPMLIDLDT